MGIYDRDYVRNRPAPVPGGARGVGNMQDLRGRSANFWLIVINIAVFVIGALLFARPIPVQSGMQLEVGVDFDRQYMQVREPMVQIPGKQFLGKAIVDTRTNSIVGYERYQMMRTLDAIGAFSTGKGLLELQVWRLVSYQFLHADINHLLLNMIGLFFFGPLVEEWLRSRRRYVAFYLTCGMFGAILYLMLNFLGYLMPGKNIPWLLVDDVYTPLIGASAGVFGVLMASAYIAGKQTMLLMFVIPIRISHGAYLLTAIEAFRLIFGSDNQGGSAAHLGGAIAGFYFIRHMNLLEGFFDILGPSQSKRPRTGNGSGAAQRRSRAGGHSTSANKRVDAILDKVSEHGMHSLTKKERAILERASRGKDAQS